MTRAWPDRAAWARHHTTAYADDVDKARDAVSGDPRFYATPTQLEQVITELREQWRQHGMAVRDANTVARNVFPRYRPRVEQPLDYFDALQALPADKRALVDHAVMLRDRRARINETIRQFTADPPRIDHWTTLQMLRQLPEDICPAWRALIGEWQACRDTAAEVFIRTVKNRPTDDQAWQNELDRRARIDHWRAGGHIRQEAA